MLIIFPVNSRPQLLTDNRWRHKAAIQKSTTKLMEIERKPEKAELTRDDNNDGEDATLYSVAAPHLTVARLVTALLTRSAEGGKNGTRTQHLVLENTYAVNHI